MMTQTWQTKIKRFITAQTISLFGSSLVQYAIIWHITLSTSSGIMMTIATICGFLPQMLISLFAGLWIDRYDRKKMIMLSDALIAIATLILAILFTLGYQNVWLFFAVLLIRSAGTGVQTPSVQAMIPQIVPKAHLMRINGLNSSLTSLIMFLSPAISGAILSVTTIEATLFIDVVTAIIGIGMMMTLKVAKVVTRDQNSTHWQDLKGGFGYVRNNPLIGRLMIFMVLLAILISPSAFLTPLMVSRVFGAEVWRLSVSEMTFSAGAILGGILIATWGGFPKRMHTTLLAGLCYGVLMIVMGLAPTFLLYLVVNCLIGITMPCYNAPITVFIQEEVQPEMQGRVFSLLQVTNSCSLPLGMVLFGPLADSFPIPMLLICAGLLVTLLVGYMWASKKLVC